MMIFKHVWILFIVVQSLNGLFWWNKAQEEIKTDTTLLPGYKKLIRGWLIYGNIPWVIMGAGILSGSVNSVFQYFNLRNGMFVILFYISIIVLWIAGSYWVFFKNGAAELVKLPGLLRPRIKDPNIIKTYFVLATLGGVIALAVMIFGNIPTITFE